MKKVFLISIIMTAVIIAFTLLPNFTFNKEQKKERVRSSGSPKVGVEGKKMRNEYFFTMLRDPKLNAIPQNMREIELVYS